MKLFDCAYFYPIKDWKRIQKNSFVTFYNYDKRDKTNENT